MSAAYFHKWNAKADKSIANTIRSESLSYLKHYDMEGMEFPEFEITDLCGNHYSNKSRGKPQYRTWFIN